MKDFCIFYLFMKKSMQSSLDKLLALTIYFDFKIVPNNSINHILIKQLRLLSIIHLYLLILFIIKNRNKKICLRKRLLLFNFIV